MALASLRPFQRVKKALVGFGLILRTSATSVLSSDPTITSGTAAPTDAEPNGSTYHRTNGQIYKRTGGAWVSVADAEENADVVIPCTHADFVAVSGTWVRTRTSQATYRIRRTAFAATEAISIEIPVSRLRTTALKGLKPTSVKIQYAISTADVVDVTVVAARTVMPTTGSPVAPATSLGAVVYDTAHDTAAERKAVGEHTLQASFTGAGYLTDGFISIEITVDSTGLATPVFDLFQVQLVASETITDAT
jgi:hypothetical protein